MTKKILFVDDDPDFTESQVAILEANNYQTSESNNGIEALDIFISDHFNLIIIDMLMPKMNEFGLFFKVKLKYPKIKLLGVTGNTSNYLPEDSPDDEKEVQALSYKTL